MKLNELKIGNLTAKLPIIQGGMGIGISLSGLASAVAKEGAIGTISGVQIGFREPDFETNPIEANLRAIGKEIKKAKESGGIIAMNLMSAMKNYDLYVKEAVKNKIDIIISGAGLPLTLPKLVEGSDTKIIPIVSSARAFKLIAKQWIRQKRLPDGVIVEGPLAGGHLGFKMEDLNEFESLESLVREVKEEVSLYEQEYNVKIPVIAAGGLHTHQDIVDIMSAGADGVQIGTRFIATDECDADLNYKKRYLNVDASDVRIIKSPVSLPARAINNDFLKKAYTDGFKVQKCYSCMPKCKIEEIPFCISKYLIDAANGKEEALLFTGANVWKIKEIVSVKKLLSELAPA